LPININTLSSLGDSNELKIIASNCFCDEQCACKSKCYTNFGL